MKTSVKKLISLLLVCVLTLGMVAAAANANSNVWDGTTLTEPAQADGVYQIGTGAELAWFAQSAAASSSAVLTADIDLGNHTWTPMAKLSGSFDGQNHTVKNLNGSNGLFTSVIGASDASRAEVKNVTVEGTVSGSAKLGAIAGTAYWANISGCINKATVSGTTNIGGIVGYSLQSTTTGSFITITNCGNEGDITGTGAAVAGVLGYAKGSTLLSGCYNTGSISGKATSYSNGATGGIIGYIQGYRNASSLTDCYNTGAVNGNGGYAGGLIGIMYNGATATNCYNTGAVTGGSGKIGAIAGYAYNASTSKAVNCYYLDTSCSAAATNKTAAIDAGTTVKTDEEMQAVAFIELLGASYKKGVTYPALNWETVELQTSAYNVTAPEAVGIIFEGAAEASSDAVYKFSVTVKDFYEITDAFAVKVNGETLDPAEVEEHTYFFEYTVTEDIVITVEGISYTGVKLDLATAELYPGETVTLTATVDPEAEGTVVWASSNEEVAAVANGVVTAVKAGNVNITASIGDASAICAVTVKHTPTEVFNTTVDPAWPDESGIGRIETLTIHDVTVKEFEWKDGKTCIVTLDRDTPLDAVVCFEKTGNASLTINGDPLQTYQHQLEDGFLKLTLTATNRIRSGVKYMIIQVEGTGAYVPVERIEIVGAPAELVGYHTVRLSVNVYPENATIQDVIWDAHAENQRLIITADGVLSVNNNAFFGGNETVTATSVDNGAIYDSVVVKAVPHKFVDEFCETSYTAADNETHLKTMKCSCGRTDTKTENCVDADENRICDMCGGPVACKHTNTTAAYVRVEGTETHTVTVTCNSCSETVGEVTTANCIDEDTNGICDLCQGVVVEPYKAAAKEELAGYKDAADYREAQQNELAAAISAGNDAIDEAETLADVTAALAAAKAAIDAIKTDAELTAEEVAAAKEEAKGALDEYKDPADYREAQQAELADAIAAGKAAIDEAETVEDVAAALAAAKAAIDEIKTDAALTAEEAAAALAAAKEEAKAELDEYKDPADYREAQQAELADAIASGKDAIDEAESIEDVAAALAAAKEAIDEIRTDAKLTAEEAAAALAAAKEEAKAELDEYKDPADYREAQQAELADAIAAGKAAIDEAETVEDVATALAAAKAAIDEIKTDAALTAEEAAAEETEETQHVCAYCGEKHTGIRGWFIEYFHDILALFRNLINALKNF